MQWDGGYDPYGTIDPSGQYSDISRRNVRSGHWEDHRPRDRSHRAQHDRYPARAGRLDGGTYGGYAPDDTGRLGNFTEVFPGFMTNDDYYGARYGDGGIGGFGTLAPGADRG